MIENGEISLDRLIFRSNAHLDNPLNSENFSLLNESEQQILIEKQNSFTHMAQMKSRLSDIRMQTLTLKVLCRIKIKNEIRTYPNDIVKLDSLSKIHQAYLTYYNPFIKTDVTD
ncbi:unnamed protein product [Adineta steineri]|nr:unnamed protein product [Adineta steineri]CAF4040787.1 unnamed protein product [Adineta steineri]